MSILTKIFGTKKDKDLKHLQPIVDKVNSFEPWAKGLKDEDFPLQTQKFRERLKNGETLDQILPEAFALVREASFRVLGERHYDVQIMGAIVLHEGKILELKTGEGKTLTSVPAGYLNALEGKGVHIVTVNDYLAERDANWMGPIYKLLGLTVGLILPKMNNVERRIAYRCDVTYGTNSEFGFDYLRDNSCVFDIKSKVQRGFNFCIVDEIDSILIDEARTPLIISGSLGEDTREKTRNALKIIKYFKECEKDPVTGEYPEANSFVANIAGKLNQDIQSEPKGDYMLDEKTKHVRFTTEGLLHMEELLNRFGIINGSLFGEEEYTEGNAESDLQNENFNYVHYVTQAMIAEHFFHKDKEYIVRDKKIQLIDEFTGRILEGRRLSNGLHEAIEAKERLSIQKQSKIIASITYQNYFKMYEKLSGMTGTADTEAIEFHEIYNLDVVVIPTNKPIIRKDLEDYVFLNEQFKDAAIFKEVKRIHETGQPILIGTTSVKQANHYYSLLNTKEIHPVVLDATKTPSYEARLIENAGAKGAVTIATNMAGRGTDIKLGGSQKGKTKEQFLKNYEEVKALGGLYILGTERHESRRIDNQLRGRSGRQGDPGTSRFFVSFDDSLVRLFASDGIRSLIGAAGANSGEPLEHSLVSRLIETAQKRVELRNFDARKYITEYDAVLEEQRNFIYSQRNSILEDKDFLERTINLCGDYIDNFIDQSTNKNGGLNLQTLRSLLLSIGFDYSPEQGDNLLPLEKLSNRFKNNLRNLLNAEIVSNGNRVLSGFIREYTKQLNIGIWEEFDEVLKADDSIARLIDICENYIKTCVEQCTSPDGKRNLLDLCNNLDISNGILQTKTKEIPRSKAVENNTKKLFCCLMFCIGYVYKPQKEDELMDSGKLSARIITEISSTIKALAQSLSCNYFRQRYLSIIDYFWSDHLEILTELRKAVSLRTIAQKNPLIEYKLESSELFDQMVDQIKKKYVTFVVLIANKRRLILEKNRKEIERNSEKIDANSEIDMNKEVLSFSNQQKDRIRTLTNNGTVFKTMNSKHRQSLLPKKH